MPDCNEMDCNEPDCPYNQNPMSYKEECCLRCKVETCDNLETYARKVIQYTWLSDVLYTYRNVIIIVSTSFIIALIIGLSFGIFMTKHCYNDRNIECEYNKIETDRSEIIHI